MIPTKLKLTRETKPVRARSGSPAPDMHDGHVSRHIPYIAGIRSSTMYRIAFGLAAGEPLSYPEISQGRPEWEEQEAALPPKLEMGPGGGGGDFSIKQH